MPGASGWGCPSRPQPPLCAQEAAPTRSPGVRAHTRARACTHTYTHMHARARARACSVCVFRAKQFLLHVSGYSESMEDLLKLQLG